MDSADDEYTSVVTYVVGELDGATDRIDLPGTETADSVLYYEAADSPTLLLGTTEYHIVEFAITPVEKSEEKSIPFDWARQTQLSVSSLHHTLLTTARSSYQSQRLGDLIYFILLLGLLVWYLRLCVQDLARRRRCSHNDDDPQQNEPQPQLEPTALSCIESIKQLDQLEADVDSELVRVNGQLGNEQKRLDAVHFGYFSAADQLLLVLEESFPARKKLEKRKLCLELYKVAIREKRDSREVFKMQLLERAHRALERARGRLFCWEEYTRLVREYARLQEANLFDDLQDEMRQELERYQTAALQKFADSISALEQERTTMLVTGSRLYPSMESLCIQDSESAVLVRGDESELSGTTSGEEGLLVAYSPRPLCAGSESQRLIELSHNLFRYQSRRDQLLIDLGQSKSRASAEAEVWWREEHARRDRRHAEHRAERLHLEERQRGLNKHYREEEELLRTQWKQSAKAQLWACAALSTAICLGALLQLTCAHSWSDVDHFVEAATDLLALPISCPAILSVACFYWQGALCSSGWWRRATCVALVLARCLPAELVRRLRGSLWVPLPDVMLQAASWALDYYFLVQPVWRRLTGQVVACLGALLGSRVIMFAAGNFWYARSFLLVTVLQAALSAAVVYLSDRSCAA